MIIVGERLTDAETDAIMTDTDTQPDIDGNLKYEGMYLYIYTILLC
jgi:hypothetical protein